jgi:tetratricopeptide (TPR) repeat protein
MKRSTIALVLMLTLGLRTTQSIGQDPKPTPKIGSLVFILPKEPTERPGHPALVSKKQPFLGWIKKIDGEWLLIDFSGSQARREQWIKALETGGRDQYDRMVQEELSKNPDDVFWLLRRGQVNTLVNRDQSRADFDKVILLDPKNVEAYLGRGLMNSLSNKHELAMADFNFVLAWDRKLLSIEQLERAYQGRAGLKEQMNDLDGSLSDFAEVIRLMPLEFSTYSRRSSIWIKKGMPDKAIAEFDEAVRIAPDRIQAYAYRSRARLDRKEYDLALADAVVMIRLEPKSPQGFSRLASIFRAQNDIDREFAELNRGIDLAKNANDLSREDVLLYTGMYHRRAQIYLQRHDDQHAFADFDAAVSLSPYALLDRADARRDRGNYDGAIDDCELWLKTYPTDLRALNNRGYIFYLKKDYTRALADFNRVLAINPLHQLALENRSNVRKATEDYDGLFADCDEVIKKNPKSDWAYVTRGCAHSVRGNLGAAIADLDEAIRINPKSAWGFNARGSVWGKSDFDKAMADFNEATRLNPKYVLPYSNRGQILVEKNEIDKALAEFDTCIRLDPTYLSAYVDRVALRRKKGDLEPAIADYTQILKLDPKANWVYLSRASQWYKMKQWDKAIADCDEAIRFDPKLVLAYNGRGSAWSKKGETKKAMADFDEAVRLEPKNDLSFFIRGREWLLHSKEPGRNERAVADLTEAIRLNPKNGVYYLARAYAYQWLGDLVKAGEDAETATRLDPKLKDLLEQNGEGIEFPDPKL